MMDDVITDEEVEVEVEKDDKNDNSKEKIMKEKKAHPDPDHPAARPDTSNPGNINSGGGGVVVADAVIETGIETGIETATDAIIDTAVDNAATTSDSDSYCSLSDCDGCCLVLFIVKVLCCACCINRQSNESLVTS